MKLFLTSAGIVPEITGDFLKLLGKEPKNTKLVFVPTAADLEEDKWFIGKDKERLVELGFIIKEIDLKIENEESLLEKLRDTDIVFVEGGNTFYLLDWVRKSGFDVAVKEFIGRGGVYVGVSAGSIITGPNIESAGWKYADKNIIGLKDLVGMNLVSFAISPHYCDEVIDVVKEAVTKVSYPTITLTDLQAVIVNGDRAEIIGPGAKITFNNPKVK
jgi:dipeptidase E